MKYNLKMKKPCGNCPYRKDAPLALWDKSHFEKLLADDKDILGSIYMCHKKNGCVCVGWAILQVKHRLPCNMLRIATITETIPFEYLESLESPTELYETVEDMVKANFPELIK